ncbi:MAG: cytochrome c [Acidobacteria bacterium]|nr:cytochrome c [Acidobacteriota bacterium]
MLAGRTPRVLLILALCLVSLSLVASHPPPTPSEPPPASDTKPPSDLGKKLFLERCGKCHDERGDKPLASGPPLNERAPTREEIARAVRGRFRDRTDDERAAVVAYIESFLKTQPRPADPSE